MLKDAEAIPREGMKWINDHSIVYAEVVLNPMIYLQKVKRGKKRERKKDVSKLTYDVNLQQEFERRVTIKIVTYVDNMK